MCIRPGHILCSPISGLQGVGPERSHGGGGQKVGGARPCIATGERSIRSSVAYTNTGVCRLNTRPRKKLSAFHCNQRVMSCLSPSSCGELSSRDLLGWDCLGGGVVWHAKGNLSLEILIVPVKVVVGWSDGVRAKMGRVRARWVESEQDERGQSKMVS